MSGMDRKDGNVSLYGQDGGNEAARAEFRSSFAELNLRHLLTVVLIKLNTFDCRLTHP